jgi:hypothetical protein
VGVKIALIGSLAQVGLALATAVGARINLLLVLVFAVRRGFLVFDRVDTIAGEICRGGSGAGIGAMAGCKVRGIVFVYAERRARRDHVCMADRRRRGGLCRLNPAAVRQELAANAGAWLRSVLINT